EEDSLSPFVCLQEKKKRAQRMQKSLEVMEEAFKKRMEAIACRWRDLQTKEIQMKSHMENSERNLKENEKVLTTAVKNVHRERERKQKESEILRAKEELKALRNKYKKLRNTVQKYLIFTKYLEDVMKISDFQEIEEAMCHYRTLVRMEKDLLQSQQGHKEMYEQAKALLEQYTAEKEAEILQYKNEMEQNQLLFDQAEKHVFLWENCWANTQDTTAEKATKVGTLKTAIFNYFQ
ncbi:CCD42 protein, partial [Upupa epops]|nr:CCD42 protein [Upupa epops]